MQEANPRRSTLDITDLSHSFVAPAVLLGVMVLLEGELN